MRKIVVDSSVILKWLSTENEKHIEQSQRILQNAIEQKVRLITPHLAHYEIGNALIRKTLELPPALDALVATYNLPLTFVPETSNLAVSSFEIACKNKITYYDASFIALAKQEKAILVTDNPKHQAKQKEVKVVSLKDYN